MPQASPDLVTKIEGYAGKEHAADLEVYCITYLLTQGYAGGRGWWGPKPGVTNVNEMTQQEYDCMWYLVTEWDWEGLRVAER